MAQKLNHSVRAVVRVNLLKWGRGYFGLQCEPIVDPILDPILTFVISIKFNYIRCLYNYKGESLLLLSYISVVAVLNKLPSVNAT